MGMSIPTQFLLLDLDFSLALGFLPFWYFDLGFFIISPFLFYFKSVCGKSQNPLFGYMWKVILCIEILPSLGGFWRFTVQDNFFSLFSRISFQFFYQEL